MNRRTKAIAASFCVRSRISTAHRRFFKFLNFDRVQSGRLSISRVEGFRCSTVGSSLMRGCDRQSAIFLSWFRWCVSGQWECFRCRGVSEACRRHRPLKKSEHARHDREGRCCRPGNEKNSVPSQGQNSFFERDCGAPR